MKLVVQRVSNASVEVEKNIVGEIEKGLVVLIGISDLDTKETVDYLIKKLVMLRIFSDENDKMNLSLKDINGELLMISQFTLFGDCSKGNRPNFMNAGKPQHANELYEYCIKQSRTLGIKVEHGIFGADMQVNLINDGPVTIILES